MYVYTLNGDGQVATVVLSDNLTDAIDTCDWRIRDLFYTSSYSADCRIRLTGDGAPVMTHADLPIGGKGITFNAPGKTHYDVDTGAWSPGAPSMRYGRFLRFLFTEKFLLARNIGERDCDAFTDACKRMTDMDYAFSIVSPGELPEWYSTRDHEELHSCMAGMNESIFDMYSLSPSCDGLLIVAHAETGTLVARAILWRARNDATGETVKYCDRIYASRQYLRSHVQQFAQLNGYDYGYDYNKLRSLSVSLSGMDSSSAWPYCDTFYTVARDFSVARNHGDGYSAQRTDGGIDGLSPMYECHNCGYDVSEDDACIVNGYPYCESCYDSMVQCAECGAMVSDDDYQEIDGETVCDSCVRYLKTCDRCGDGHRYAYFNSIPGDGETVERVCHDCLTDDDYETCHDCDGKNVRGSLIEINGTGMVSWRVCNVCSWRYSYDVRYGWYPMSQQVMNV